MKHINKVLEIKNLGCKRIETSSTASILVDEERIIKILGVNKMEEISNLYKVIAETEKDFNNLPFFVRPFIKSEFESKTGMTLEQWKSSVSEINKLNENYDEISPIIKGKLDSIKPRLERLVIYIQGVPEMAKKFIKDPGDIEKIKQTAEYRKQIVLKVIEKIKA